MLLKYLLIIIIILFIFCNVSIFKTISKFLQEICIVISSVTYESKGLKVYIIWTIKNISSNFELPVFINESILYLSDLSIFINI